MQEVKGTDINEIKKPEPEEYKNIKSRIELLEILTEAEDDFKNGRLAPIGDTFDELRALLQEG